MDCHVALLLAATKESGGQRGYAREGIMITDIGGTILDVAMWRDLIETGYWSNETWNKRKSGEVYPQLLTISAVPDAQGIVRQYVALFSDITVRKQMEDQIRQLAFLDPLTRLPNRRMLNDRLSQAHLFRLMPLACAAIPAFQTPLLASVVGRGEKAASNRLYWSCIPI